MVSNGRAALSSASEITKALIRGGVQARSLSALLPEKPAPSRLEEARARFRKTLDEMKSLFRTMAIDRGLNLGKATENEFVGLLSVEGETRLLAEISFWLGVFHAAAKNWDEARKRFLSATFLDPTFVADRRLFPPPIVELFNRVRAAHPSLARSALSVISTPPGARVFLDGRLVARAPCTIDLLDGEHILAAEIIAHQPFVARVAATPSKIETQNVFLTPLTSDTFFASLARETERGSPDFASPQAVAALGKVMAADVVVVVSVDAKGVALIATSVLTAAPVASTVGASADESTAALLKKLRPPPPPLSILPRTGESEKGVRRMSLKLSTAFEVAGSGIEGVAIHLVDAEFGFVLTNWVRLIAGAGFSYAPNARANLLSQPTVCSSSSGCPAGSGSAKAAVPLWIGASWALATRRAFSVRFDTAADFSLFSFSEFGGDPSNKATSPGSFTAPSLGFRVGPSVEFRLSDSWSLAGSAAYRFSVLFPPSLTQQIQGGAPSSAWFSSTKVHAAIVSLGATVAW